MAALQKGVCVCEWCSTECSGVEGCTRLCLTGFPPCVALFTRAVGEQPFSHCLGPSSIRACVFSMVWVWVCITGEI